MYRYERPQSGRFREFYQFGVEVFGSENPYIDAEVISIPVNFYKLLGLKGIKVKINSLGDAESRNAYREALLKHFEPYLDTLCDDCKVRYHKNPLRILDCKVDNGLECMKNAPRMLDYLNDESKQHFEQVKHYLDILEIPYEVNPNIVRGLDYYTHTVFEVEADIEGFGSQNVLCGGGRYNHLIEQIGGPSTPSVGFALGMERLLNALESEAIHLGEQNIDLYIIPVQEEQIDYAVSLAQQLRMNGFSVDIDYMKRNIKGNFKQADRLHASYVLILGEEEVEKEVFTIKNNQSKEEYKVEMDELIHFLDHHIEEKFYE